MPLSPPRHASAGSTALDRGNAPLAAVPGTGEPPAATVRLRMVLVDPGGQPGRPSAVRPGTAEGTTCATVRLTEPGRDGQFR
ncbi:hypothetical protein V6U90_06005 [Micromonospora sp. CPCC 206060]|uniref:hypothetical protein n=1 Tax=Micromonospora sp. CPCC 206060 TaxID=3122406 RepID=UPI002FF2B52C